MQQDSVLDDGQAKTSAAEGAAAPVVDAVEALKDAGQVLRGDARAVVLEGEVPTVGLLVGRDSYGCTFAGIAEGVVRQVAEDAIDE